MIPRGTNDWLSVFPLERELAEWKYVGDEEERVLFVDVGGGRGQQCVALRKKYSELKGRVVLQDLKETVERRPEIEGVEVMVQDFWKPQAVKGMSHIIHQSLIFAVSFTSTNLYRSE